MIVAVLAKDFGCPLLSILEVLLGVFNVALT